MKKKIIGFCLVFCMIFPCFFVVACKGKKDGDRVSAYTYSVTLKNAKGKVDSSTLAGEYDYANQSKTTWVEEGNDYTISVTRTNVLSGNAVVSLLEGIDYSNLSLTVNGKSAEWIVKSGSNLNCASEAYISDRQFRYTYSKMSSNTNIIVDFSSCETAKITLDVSELRKNNVSYYLVEDDFMTLEEANDLNYSSFKTFTSDTMTLDYGTMIAFDYSEQLVLNSSSLQNLQKLNHAKYGSRYFVPFNNRLQYLEVQRNGACEVYTTSSDNLLNGTLRILSSTGLLYASSLEALEAKRYGSAVQETEYFDGEKFSMSILKGRNLFIELNEDAQGYNYYLVSKLDEKLSSSKNLLTQKVFEASSRKYLEINLTESNGEAGAVKYLVRRPARESDYFIVYASGLKENTRFANADAIVVGLDNKPGHFHSSIKDSILYYFKKGSTVRIAVPAAISDKETNGNIFIRDEKDDSKGITLYTQAYNPTTGKTVGSLANIFTNPSKYHTVEWDGYVAEPNSLYRFSFTYSEDNFDSVVFQANTNNLKLYESETVYYSTNPVEASSWKKLDTNQTFELTSYVGKSLYYYIDTNRTDAYLWVKNAIGENISETGKLYDCFGRVLTGSVEVNGVSVDLSKIRYLDIMAGYYTYNNLNASIIRGYDESYHKINTMNVVGQSVMVSNRSYTEHSSFSQIDEHTNLEIRYTGLNNTGEIYYYIEGATNQYLVLKNASNEIVGESELIYNNGKAEVINGKYVYCLRLIGDYYDEGEEFYIDIVDVTYSLYDENGYKIDVYTSIYMSQTTNELVAQKNGVYYITCPYGSSLKIVNNRGITVIDSFEELKDVPVIGTLYKFEFVFPAQTNYEPGSKFFVIYESTN